MDYGKLAEQFGGERVEPEATSNEQTGSEFKEIAQRFGGTSLENQEQVTASLFGQSDFGEADISFWDRMRISTGDTFQEQKNIFLRNYPEGDFERVPATGDLVFRRDPSESYRKFNPEGFDKTDLAAIGGQSIAPLTGELIAMLTLGAQSGGNPQLTAARYGARSLNKASNVIGRMVAGAFGGEAAEQGTQLLSGVQEDDFVTAAFNRPATEGLFSLGGGVIGEVGSRALDGIRGAGVFSLKPGASEAIQAADRQNVPRPLPGQTTRSNFVSRVQGQAGQTSPAIQESLDIAGAQTSQRLRDMSSLSPNERINAIKDIEEAFERAKNDLVLEHSSKSNLSREDIGLYFQTIRTDFVETSQTKVSDAYNIAISFENPVFDPSSLLDTARETAKQIKITTTRPGQPQAGSIVDSRGIPLSEPTATSVTSSEPIRDQLGEVREIAEQIARADPESLGLDQLRKFEQALFDLSQPVDGVIKDPQKQARTLRKKVKETLDNPLNQGKEFGEAWRTARESAANRFNILEDSFVAQIAATDRPSTIADHVFNPNVVTPSDVRIVRMMTDSDKFGDVQAAFADRLLQDPDKLSTVLETFDQDVLSLMLSPQQLNRFKALGKQVDNLNLTGIKEAASRQIEFKPFIDDLVTGENSTVKINALFEFVNRNGGKDGALGRIVRTGLIEDLTSDVIRRASQKKGGENIKVEAFNEALEDFNQRGLDKFFTRTELRNLKDLVQIADFSDAAGEGVAQLLGATASQGALKGRFESIFTLMRNFGVGQFLTSETGKTIIQGVGNAKSRRELILPVTSASFRLLKESEALGEDEKLPSVDDVVDFVTSKVQAEQ